MSHCDLLANTEHLFSPTQLNSTNHYPLSLGLDPGLARTASNTVPAVLLYVLAEGDATVPVF